LRKQAWMKAFIYLEAEEKTRSFHGSILAVDW